MKALSTKRLYPVRIVRALRYPTYQRLAMQRTLVPAFGSMIAGAGNLCSLGLGALHGSASFSLLTAHIVTHVVIVVPMGQKKGMC